jgi:toxin ParE1/3/4
LKIVFTPSGRAQYLDAIRYIQRDNPSAAEAFHARASKTLSRLKNYPQSGRPLPEFPGLAFREVIVTPYRFFYRVAGKTVWIVAVWHGARIPKSPQGG